MPTEERAEESSAEAATAKSINAVLIVGRRGIQKAGAHCITLRADPAARVRHALPSARAAKRIDKGEDGVP